MSPEQITIFDLLPPDTLDLANLLVLPGSEKARMMTAISGRKLIGYYKRSDPIGLLARMLLGTSHWASTKCLMTWLTSGTPRNRLLFQLAVSEQITDENGYSLLPTPTSSMWRGTAKSRYRGSRKYKGSFTMEALRNGPNDAQYINPSYLELLMGFPDRWTELEPSEMQSYHSKSIPS